MPAQRTLITTCSGIGIGVLGKRFAEYFPDCWDEVIAFPTRERKIDLEIHHPRLRMLEDAKQLPGVLMHGQRVFFIESSYGATDAVALDALMVPMFESGHTATEMACQRRVEIISPNEFCRVFMHEHFKRESIVLRMPMDMSEYPFRARRAARVFIHNAGSLGQAYRKGTDFSIEMWQRSRLGHDGRTLRIHSFMACPPPLAAMIARDPAGIEWTGTFAGSVRSILEDGDVFFLTAKAEGDSMTMPEAMAMGLPCIYPDYSPVNEVAPWKEWSVRVASKKPIPWNQRCAHHQLDLDHGAEVLRWAATQDLFGPSHDARESAVAAHGLPFLRERWMAAITAD